MTKQRLKKRASNATVGCHSHFVRRCTCFA
jgi:hypothetical protein